MAIAVVLTLLFSGVVWFFSGSIIITLVLTGINFIILGVFARADSRHRKKILDFNKDLPSRIGLLIYNFELFGAGIWFVLWMASIDPHNISLQTFFITPFPLQVLIVLLFVLNVFILYKTVFYEVIHPYSDDELKEPAHREIVLGCDAERAFDLCILSLSLINCDNVSEADRESRRIHASTTDWSELTFTLERISDQQTWITLDCIRFMYQEGYRDSTVRRITGQNERIANILGGFLQDQESPELPCSPYMTSSIAMGSKEVIGKRIIAPNGKYFYKNPNLAAGLSIIPGLGSGYNAKGIEGFLIAFGAWFGLFLWYIPGIVIWFYGIYYAYRTAGKISRQEIPYRGVSLLWIVLILLVIPAFLFVAYMILSVFQYPGMPGIIIPMRPLSMLI